MHENGPHTCFEVANWEQHPKDVGTPEDEQSWSFIEGNVGGANCECQNLEICVDSTFAFTSCATCAKDQQRII